MRQLVGAAITIATSIGMSPATAQLPRGQNCHVSAFVTDRDPNGINVRAGPSASARVLRAVSNRDAAVVEVSGHAGGWFRVSRIVNAEDGSELYRGEGWVSGSLLGLAVANADPRLYEAPSTRSRVIASLEPDMSELRLIGCSGDWVRVRSGRHEGWLSRGGQCSSPLTTCV